MKLYQQTWRCISCCQGICSEGGVDECRSQMLCSSSGKTISVCQYIVLVHFCWENEHFCATHDLVYSIYVKMLSMWKIKCRSWFLPNQWQVRDFERNGLNLTSTKREELLRLRAQIDEVSLRYVQNLSDDGSFLLFNESELAGLPPGFLKV